MSRSIRECIRWRVSTAKKLERWNSITHFTWDSLRTVPYLPAGPHAQHDSLAWVSFSGGAYQRGGARPPTNCRASCLTSGLTAPLRCLAPSVHNNVCVCVISFNHLEPESNACVFIFQFHEEWNLLNIPQGDRALNAARRVIPDNACKWPPWQIGWPGPRGPWWLGWGSSQNAKWCPIVQEKGNYPCCLKLFLWFLSEAISQEAPSIGFSI